MANQSGIVTSKDGTLTIIATRNDSVTFTPTAATYTVEYPIGTVSIAGATTAQTVSLTPGGIVLLRVASGSVAYALTDGADDPGIGGGGGSAALQALGSVSGPVSINLSLGANAALTIGGAATLTFTNTPSNNTAQRAVLTITNGGAGAITWPAGIRWAGAGVVGSAPTLVASGVEKVVIDISNIAGALVYDGSYIGRVA